MMTYRTLVRYAQNYFPDIADAEYFIQGLTNKNRFELCVDNSWISHKVINKFHKLLNKAKTGMPAQYLLHKAYFLSYELYVDERVLIPRFETEELVIKSVARIKELNVVPKMILDIGVGSGAISVALADLFPEAKILATDISCDALDVAQINIRKYNFEKKILLEQADLFPKTFDKFDLIISNPPYIPHNKIENLPSQVKNYEPMIALNGGKQGFEIIKRIIKQMPSYLSKKSIVALEIDPHHQPLITNLISNVQFEKDNQGLIRYAFFTFKQERVI